MERGRKPSRSAIKKEKKNKEEGKGRENCAYTWAWRKLRALFRVMYETISGIRGGEEKKKPHQKNRRGMGGKGEKDKATKMEDMEPTCFIDCARTPHQQ